MTIPLGSLACALVFAGVYALGSRLGTNEGVERMWARRRWISAAAGVSVAYVFIDVLPELEVHRRIIVEASGGERALFAEQRIYMLALVSFVVFYGLEHMVLVAKGRRASAVEAGATDAAYWLHLGGFAAYSGLIGYLVVERAEKGPLSLAAYTFAMAVHFMVVDHALGEEHGGAYRQNGRWLLAASVVAGWLLGTLAPISDVILARLFAILAGGVVITSLRSELPDERNGRFWPFCLAAVGYAGLLALA